MTCNDWDKNIRHNTRYVDQGLAFASQTGDTHLEHGGEVLEFVKVDSFVFFILSYHNIRLACITIQTHMLTSLHSRI
jgi:hypothetical protein